MRSPQNELFERLNKQRERRRQKKKEKVKKKKEEIRRQEEREELKTFLEQFKSLEENVKEINEIGINCSIERCGFRRLLNPFGKESTRNENKAGKQD